MLAGDYRKIIAKPGDLEGAEVHYMKMDDANSVDEGPIRGLQVSFSLPSSCYATMCLRELTQSSMQ